MTCVAKDKTKDSRYYIFKCSLCGNTKSAILYNVKSGATNSCGCYKSKRNTKHGDRYKRIYKIWRAMRQRCNDKNCSNYQNYGGRGISVCLEWNDYVCFRDWAYENGYSDKLTIDRINTNGNYEPSNCRWATYEEQANNTRVTKFITVDGKRDCVHNFSKEYGISASIIHARLKKGWSEEDAVKVEIGGKNSMKKKQDFYKKENKILERIAMEEKILLNKKKLSERMKKKVCMIDDSDNILVEFSSLKEAEEKLGIRYQTISAVCRGVKKTAGGYKWKYK